MKTIKNILVPTDFSVTARNAFHYARVLADAINAKITVLHVNEYFLAASEIAVAPSSESEEARIKEAMDRFISDEGEGDAIMVKADVKTRILRGETVTRIVEQSQSEDVDLIVMGTTGLQDFLSKIIGSISLDVANKAHCPVVLVPRDARWSRIDRMMFASNYESTTPTMVHEISEFAKLFGSSIHFVHVNTQRSGEDKITETIWNELYEAADPVVAFEVHTIYGSDAVKHLRKYAYENDINLIAFVSKHRSFWQNLIHNSVSQNIAISTDIPMMVIHYDDYV
jgi:nucleotide-binding universal stress UspA family protein